MKVEDPWIVKIKVNGVSKFWAGPNVGNGTVGTTARNAKRFPSRSQARAATEELRQTSVPVGAAIKLSKALSAQDEAVEKNLSPKDRFSIDVLSALKKVDNGNDLALTSTHLARELTTMGYTKK